MISFRRWLNVLAPWSSTVKTTRYKFGCFMSQTMTHDQHVNSLVCSCSNQLRNIAKLRPLSQNLKSWKWSFMLLFLHDLITATHFFHLSKQNFYKPFTSFIAAAKLLTKVTERSRVSPILSSLHWLSIQLRIQSKIMVITFRALHGEAPSYNSFYDI